MDRTDLKHVAIPYGVTGIGVHAFKGCTGLTSIRIPDSVTSIGECAFSGCTSLNAVRIPDSVADIGEYAFDGVPHIIYNGSAASGNNWGAVRLTGE